MASPFNDRVYENYNGDASDVANSYWQSSWPLGDKFPVGFNAVEPEQRSAVDDRFHATFPLSHL